MGGNDFVELLLITVISTIIIMGIICLVTGSDMFRKYANTKNGCFAIANPLKPVYSGELQGPGLGMDIDCFDAEGNSIRDREGELVCKIPAPSMPLYFWNDEGGKRGHYHLRYINYLSTYGVEYVPSEIK